MGKAGPPAKRDRADAMLMLLGDADRTVREGRRVNGEV